MSAKSCRGLLNIPGADLRGGGGGAGINSHTGAPPPKKILDPPLTYQHIHIELLFLCETCLLKGLGYAILGNFSTDQMVIELTKI